MRYQSKSLIKGYWMKGIGIHKADITKEGASASEKTHLDILNYNNRLDLVGIWEADPGIRETGSLREERRKEEREKGRGKGKEQKVG